MNLCIIGRVRISSILFKKLKKKRKVWTRTVQKGENHLPFVVGGVTSRRLDVSGRMGRRK